MKAGTAISMALVGLLASCTQAEAPSRDVGQEAAVRSPTVEEFAPVFDRMKADPAFARLRMADGFTISEHFYSMGDDWEGVSRTLRCTPEALRSKGWDRIPSREEIVRIGAEYGAPERQSDGRLVVRLGTPDSDVLYSDYAFTLTDGRWRWSSEDVYYMQGPTDPILPPPCPTAPATGDARPV